MEIRISILASQEILLNGDAAQLSGPNAYGDHLFLVAWEGVQFGSVWNDLDYRLFRIGPRADRAVSLFTDHRGFVAFDPTAVNAPVEFRLTADGLLIEFTSEALEPGLRRTHVVRYRTGTEGVQRIDPVALQPQDFVHEWLKRP